MNTDCDLIQNFLAVLWTIVGAAIVGPVCYFLGRRSHPVERAAKRGEYVYRGPGGGR